MEVDSSGWLLPLQEISAEHARMNNGWSSSESSSFHFDESDSASSSGASTHDTSDDTHDHSDDWRVSLPQPHSSSRPAVVYCLPLFFCDSGSLSRAADLPQTTRYKRIMLTFSLLHWILSCIHQRYLLQYSSKYWTSDDWATIADRYLYERGFALHTKADFTSKVSLEQDPDAFFAERALALDDRCQVSLMLLTAAPATICLVVDVASDIPTAIRSSTGYQSVLSRHAIRVCACHPSQSRKRRNKGHKAIKEHPRSITQLCGPWVALLFRRIKALHDLRYAST